jgi:outer membrane protein, multidrug efflux system
MNSTLRIVLVLLPLWLAGCATSSAPRAVSAPVPAQWLAPLPPLPQEVSFAPTAKQPHNASLSALTQWWQQQGDPLLVDLISAAQAVSPTVASARSRIEQSRAARVAAGAALTPTLDASVSASRGNTSSSQSSQAAQQPGAPGAAPIATMTQAGLQAAWEIDLFGGNRASQDAASERLAGAQAQWHDARVSVAAEVANQYYALRSCRQLAQITQADAASRQETARLSTLSTQAGFTAPATNALARASAFEGSGRATQQRAQCALDVKALVAMTGLPEPEIQSKMAVAQQTRAQTATISIASVPADALAQRPDIFSAEREVAAASADIGSAQAQRYPRLSLSGAIGRTGIRSSGESVSLDTWFIGPLALTLPLFDGGRRAANVDAAKARYDEAAALYRARVRQAVREVEEALVTLQSTAGRETDAQGAVAGFQASFTGTEARYQSGLAGLVELEDARRSLLAAQITQASVQRERRAASVALYRAMGGGWTPALDNTASAFSVPAASQSNP